ncbi:MAG: hypothetical protein RMK01_03675 [Thermomicrobium sp.]|nr:hypothetical protein [Thermomicrobium sp.]MDW8059154.1 hypothetical protein [Thermomicrobium sp.]
MIARLVSAFLVLLLLAAWVLRPTPPPRVHAASPVPVLAYYYIWFDPTSWNRAKRDYPILGRYSSDDRAVMQQHIRWAEQAGITGFIVSWKSTPTLNRRLEQLAELATSEGFHLAIIYQGLDFERDPLPAERIASDLAGFCQRWSGRNVFNDLFGKPLVILSGTWEFSPDDIASIRQRVGSCMLLLASERNVDGYERLALLVDGNAYYWSSVDPDTYPDYVGKLRAMSDAVHAHGGLWIAPAAPGFDARLIGGTRVVERKNGDTFRRQLAAAFASAPDAIGIISWNEFSENTHIEPSLHEGDESLRVLASVLGEEALELPPLGSEALPPTGTSYGLPLLGLASAVFVGSAGFLAYRIRRRPAPPGARLAREPDRTPLGEP